MSGVLSARPWRVWAKYRVIKPDEKHPEGWMIAPEPGASSKEVDVTKDQGEAMHIAFANLTTRKVRIGNNTVQPSLYLGRKEADAFVEGALDFAHRFGLLGLYEVSKKGFLGPDTSLWSKEREGRAGKQLGVPWGSVESLAVWEAKSEKLAESLILLGYFGKAEAKRLLTTIKAYAPDGFPPQEFIESAREGIQEFGSVRVASFLDNNRIGLHLDFNNLLSLMPYLAAIRGPEANRNRYTSTCKDCGALFVANRRTRTLCDQCKGRSSEGSKLSVSFRRFLSRARCADTGCKLNEVVPANSPLRDVLRDAYKAAGTDGVRQAFHRETGRKVAR